MLRWACFLPAAIGGAALAPTLERGAARDLETEWKRTTSAIEQLKALGESLRGGDREALSRVFEATEAPLPDPRASADLLDRLRADIARLLERDDAGASMPCDAKPRAAITAGLDATLREALAAGDARTRFERDGYSADPLREGVARFLANDPKAALTALERASGDARAAYWTARCHEALGDFERARSGYEALAADRSNVELAERAALDLSIVDSKKRLRAGRTP